MATHDPVTPASLGAELLAQAREYGRLMRLDRPIGIWLLLWPTLWALWIASEGAPDPQIFAVFVIGVIVMRSAGCVMNDFADRRFDPHVTRTKDRPLAAGAVTPLEAMVLFAALGLVAIALLLTLNSLTRWLAIVGAILTVVYPFAKRVFPAPQLLLGIAFGWGVPMAFSAQTGSVPRLAWLILLAAIVWAVIYDTMYAMADREDDLRIGLKSTAILFGGADVFMVTLLQFSLVVALVLIGKIAALGIWYFVSVGVAGLLLMYQRILIREREPDACFEAFMHNRHLGAAVFIGILLDFTFRAS